jgi:hypothetical protein
VSLNPIPCGQSWGILGTGTRPIHSRAARGLWPTVPYPPTPDARWTAARTLSRKNGRARTIPSIITSDTISLTPKELERMVR